jgi:predicted nucleic acid-binding protein
MAPTVYVESSTISYLVARPTRDLLRNAWQAATARWWANGLARVRPCISPFVIDEISAGDPVAASERLAAIKGFSVLAATDDVVDLAEYLLLGGGLPAKARYDALHIACAAVHGVNIVVTWNFRHIANPVQLPIMRGLCSARGYRLPELVSPIELLEVNDAT